MANEKERRQPKKPQTTSSTTDATVSSMLNPRLPQEIIVEILARLPVKSLLQCRCVSKSWRCLISDPKFIKTQLTTSKTNPKNQKLILSSSHGGYGLKACSLHSVFYEPSVNAVDLDYPMKNPHRSVWIVGSYNGLLCIAIEENTLFLWNPSTRKSRLLPGSDIDLRYGCYVIYGFAYDLISDDYKVVGIYCVFRDRGVYETDVKVYSLRTDSWRRIQCFPFGIPLDDSGKFANGALHWAASRDIGSGGSAYSWSIVSFDLGKETYKEVLQPRYGDGDFDLTLGVLRESLCVLCNYAKARADVWVMKEYGVRESWSKLISIPYLTDPGKYQYSVPLCISKDGDILLELRYILGLYSSKSNTFKVLEISNFDACLEANTYAESLVSPNFHNPVEGLH